MTSQVGHVSILLLVNIYYMNLKRHIYHIQMLHLTHKHLISTGLLYLHGAEYKLKHLSLHSNRLGSINQLLQCMLGLQSLSEVTLCVDGKDNPLCSSPGKTAL